MVRRQETRNVVPRAAAFRGRLDAAGGSGRQTVGSGLSDMIVLRFGLWLSPRQDREQKRHLRGLLSRRQFPPQQPAARYLSIGVAIRLPSLARRV